MAAVSRAAVGGIDLRRCRDVLGEAGAHLSDEQCAALLEFLVQLAEVAYEEKRIQDAEQERHRLR